MEHEKPFRVLVAGFGTPQKWLVINQVIGSGLAHPVAMISTKVSMAEVLGILEPKEGEKKGAKSHADVSVPTEQSNAATNSSKGDPLAPGGIEELDSLNLRCVTESHYEKLREVLREFTPMWDGSLGKIGITEHQIDVFPNTGPIS